MYAALVYVVPTLFSLIYLLFGDSFFLFAWVDSALVSLIQFPVSAVVPVFNQVTILLGLLAYGSMDPTDNVFLLQIALLALQGYLWTWFDMSVSVDAIRYLDPEWDLVEPGGLLWPFILYDLGLVDYRSHTPDGSD